MCRWKNGGRTNAFEDLNLKDNEGQHARTSRRSSEREGGGTYTFSDLLERLVNLGCEGEERLAPSK